MEMNEERKRKERHFHDTLRETQSPTAKPNHRFYYIARSSRDYTRGKLSRYCTNSMALDYGCGDGESSIFMAKAGAQVVGIDISDVSLQNARQSAVNAGVGHTASFMVMDGESLSFTDNTFDLIHIDGVLHHLDVRSAFPELSRILKPGGNIIAREALGHNPFIQLYRRLTPRLRTAWETEHIIKRRDMRLSGDYFCQVNYRFFHLVALAGVPLRKTRGFSTLLKGLDMIDRFLLGLPGLRWQAWQVVIELSEPIKTANNSYDLNSN